MAGRADMGVQVGMGDAAGWTAAAHVLERDAEVPGAPAYRRRCQRLVALGVERTNLHKKIRAYGIKRGEG